MTIGEVKQLIELHIARYRTGIAEQQQKIKECKEELETATDDNWRRLRIALQTRENMLADYGGRISGLSILLAEMKESEGQA